MFAKLLLLFILVPLAELYLFMTIGANLGFPLTIGIIIITAILGAALAKSQGRQALARFQLALREGRMPHREATDGLIILVAGAFLLTPGFLTDALGFSLLLPPVRALMLGTLAKALMEKIHIVPGATQPGQNTPFPNPSQPRQDMPPDSKLDDDKVIDV